MAGRGLLILIVEDDPNDTFLLKRAFQKTGISLPMHHCCDGAEAMEYLRGDGQYADRQKFPFPRVLITDLKMPRSNGFDLLEWLKNHPECNLIPKIVLSASADLGDVTKAYQLGANCYFQKPSEFDELCNIVELANRFWLKAVLPPLPERC
jgi:CheY-like chemotaxis protein